MDPRRYETYFRQEMHAVCAEVLVRLGRAADSDGAPGHDPEIDRLLHAARGMALVMRRPGIASEVCRAARAVRADLPSIARASLRRVVARVRRDGATAGDSASGDRDGLLDVLSREIDRLSRRLDKRARLDVAASDRARIRELEPALWEPVLQIVRNAVTHGIERSDERARRGKPPVGRITFRSTRSETAAEIEIADDGRGMDLEALRASAVRSGVRDAAQVDAMSDHEITALAWLPGVSTVEGDDPEAGAGVGMDGIRSVVRRLGGEISIASEPRSGVRVHVRVPIPAASDDDRRGDAGQTGRGPSR